LFLIPEESLALKEKEILINKYHITDPFVLDILSILAVTNFNRSHLHIVKDKKISEFVIDDNIKKIKKYVEMFQDNHNKKKNGLFVYGYNTDTFLMNLLETMIAYKILEHHKGYGYIPMHIDFDLLCSFINNTGFNETEKHQDIINQLLTVNGLFIISNVGNEIGFGRDNYHFKNVKTLERIVNARINKNLPIMVTSVLTLNEFEEKYNKGLVSLLKVKCYDICLEIDSLNNDIFID